MLKAIATVMFLLASGVGQSSSGGFFVVRHIKKSDFSLTSAQMHEAEKLYVSTCAVVQRDFPGSGELRPRFTVLLGTDRDEVHGLTEIRLRQWNPGLFAQGVVILAFDQVLTSDVIRQMAKRGMQYANAVVDVHDLKETH
ncbi:MAG TPA: hypothetical protein VEG68_17500 [Terriglobales bacterium]|nr:hypothetical protein [Terriglobales bacterium]